MTEPRPEGGSRLGLIDAEAATDGTSRLVVILLQRFEE
jgi:hypothetical protein